ncbi:TerD family protein [Streptomyces sp. NPDC048290]|uniref:TerD family protein n=1 Tax=Streptomyces sp. NPDC048290 TaxID=3155811 RepID=UPI003426CA4A
MTYITKGANTPVPAAPLRVAVGRADVPGTPAVDAAALLLDATGRVRGDADMVFHNQPRHPSGALRHAGLGQGAGQSAEWLEVDLPRLEPAVQRVVIAGSCDGGTFGQVPGLYVQAVGPDGTVAAHYAVTDAAAETAFVLGEFYRRDGAWKFRAVGQGYDTGLAGLATDFGVAVAGAPPQPQPSAPIPAPAPLSAPAPAAPVLNSAVSKTSGPPPVPSQPSAPIASPSPIPSPIPSPSPSPSPVAFPVPSPTLTPAAAPPAPLGTDFAPFARSGKGNDVVTVDVPLPPGPVIVEMGVQGDDWLCVETLDRRNKEDQLVFNSTLRDLHGRALVQPPEGRPLRLRVKYAGEWWLKVLPLTAARVLGRDTVEGRGPEVLVYTGTTGDVKVRFDGGPDKEAWMVITGHHPEHLDDLDQHDLLVNQTGKLKETFPIPEGPHLVVVEKADGKWQLIPRPLPVRDPVQGLRSGVYEGRGERTITLANPAPGRPALVRYEFKDVRHRYDLATWRLDEYGAESDWLSGSANGTRGTGTMFSRGQAEMQVRIKHGGDWTLRVLPETDAPLLTGPVEGEGTTVLRYQGPPTLMTLEQKSRSNDAQVTAHALNHPYGNTAIIASVRGRRPALGPVWVDPGGTCFVVVTAAENTKWRLEPQPPRAATPLGPRTQGVGYGVVHHTGPVTEIVFASTSGLQHLYQLDENLFPAHKVTGSSDPYRVSEGFLHVRALGEWTIDLRGRQA